MMVEYFDVLVVIFLFEVECYVDMMLKLEFVGYLFFVDDYVVLVKYDLVVLVLLLLGSCK